MDERWWQFLFWVTAYEHSLWNWIVKRRVSLGWNQWKSLRSMKSSNTLAVEVVLLPRRCLGRWWRYWRCFCKILLHHAKATEHLYIQGNLFRKCLRKKHVPTGLLRNFVQGYTISDDWNFDRWKFQPVSIVPCFRNSDSLTVPWSNANMETMKLSVVFMFFFHWLGLTIWSLNGWNLSTIFCAIKHIVQIVRGRQYMMNAFRLSLLHPAMTLMCVLHQTTSTSPMTLRLSLPRTIL